MAGFENVLNPVQMHGRYIFHSFVFCEQLKIRCFIIA